MILPQHNEWSNEATWSIFTNFTRYKETRISIKQRAEEGTEQVQSLVEQMVRSWFEGVVSDEDNQALQHIGKELIQLAIRRVWWAYVYDALRGKTVPEPPNEFTRIAYELLSTQDWEEIVEGSKNDSTAVDALAERFERHCLTWANIPDDRKRRGLISKFTFAVMDVFIQSVNWDEVTEVLKNK
jgi:hypothetical protein